MMYYIARAIGRVDSSRSLRISALILAGLLIAALVPTGQWLLPSFRYELIAVALVAAMLVGAWMTTRYPPTFLIFYWLLYSFASESRLAIQIHVRSLPITIPDLAVLMLGLATLVRLRHRDDAAILPTWTLPALLLALLALDT